MYYRKMEIKFMPSLHEDYERPNANFILDIQVGKYDLNERDRNGNTILYLLAASALQIMPSFNTQYLSDLFETLIKGGANPLLCNNQSKDIVDIIFDWRPKADENMVKALKKRAIEEPYKQLCALYSCIEKYFPADSLLSKFWNIFSCYDDKEFISLIDTKSLPQSSLE